MKKLLNLIFVLISLTIFPQTQNPNLEWEQTYGVAERKLISTTISTSDCFNEELQRLNEKRLAQNIALLKNTNAQDESVLDSAIRYRFTDTSSTDSIPDYKWIYSYDSNNNIIQEAYHWDFPYWKRIAKTVFIYDSNDKLVLKEGYAWDDTTNDLKRNYKIVYSYDSNNNLIIVESYNWDNNSWKRDSKTVFGYDSINNEILKENYRWDNGWKSSSKSVSSYDSHNNLILYKRYNWDDTTNDWKRNRKSVSSYDSNNNRILSENHLWNDTTNDWKESSKGVYSYDSNNNLIIVESYNWDDTTNDWKSSSKSVSSYDSNNNLILNEIYSWNDTTNDWKRKFKSGSSYDSNNNLILFERYIWDDTTNNFYKDITEIYYYSNLNYTEITLYIENIQTYPNPVKDILYVNLENVKLNVDKILLFNSTGKLVFSSEGTELKSKIIEITTLNYNTGLYNLNLYTKQGVIHRKIVIVR